MARKNKNIMITGGTGFLGNNLTRYMLAKYPERLIVNYSRHTYAVNPLTHKDLWKLPMYKSIAGDLNNVLLFKETLEKYKIGTIIHLAASTHVDRCYSSDTEILTENGWKSYTTISKDMNLITLNSKTREIEYQKPTEIIVEEYNGELLHFSANYMDLLVSPNHNMYISTERSNSPEFKFKKAKDIFNISRFRYLIRGKWNGIEKNSYILKGQKVRRGYRYKQDRLLPDLILSMKKFLQFLGFWIAEGCVLFKRNDVYLCSSNFKILLSFKKWLKSLSINSSIYQKRNNYFQLHFSDARFASYLRKMKPDKFIPKDIKNLSKGLLLILWKYYMIGDGHQGITINGTTVSKRLANDLQEIALKIGMGASIYPRKEHEFISPSNQRKYRGRKSYRINFRKKMTPPYAHNRGKFIWKKIKYSGKIWCVTVPNHLVYIRRNGKCCWSGNSFIYPEEFLQANVCGNFAILEVLRRIKKKPLLLYYSTDEVFGDVPEGFCREDDLRRPRNPYSASKASAEMYCVAYYHSFNIPIIISRSMNMFGPYQHPEKLIGKIITRCLTDEHFTLYKGGSVRGWLYVEDACDAIDTTIKKGKVGEIYHIPPDAYLTVPEVAETILKITGKQELFDGYKGRRLKDDERYALDATKFTYELKWRPPTRFDKGIRLTIDWFKRNPWFWTGLHSHSQ